MHPPRGSSNRHQGEKSLPSLPATTSPYIPQHTSPLSNRLSRTSSSPSLHPDTDPRVKPQFRRLNTIPLDPACVQNKALFGGCVTFYEKEILDGSDHGHRRRNEGRGVLWKLMRTWWLEGVCILVMAACLVAIVLTLRLHEGQPLPAWKQFYGVVNINALLSVYYTIFKGCMLLVVEEVLSQLKWAWFQEPRSLWDLERFNEASRGPKGAIQLLWSSIWKLKAGFLPIVGALLVLFALAIDPFTQQIVSYYSCQRPSPTLRASIPRTNNFTTSSWLLGSSGYGGSGNITIDLGLQGATYAGIFDASPVGSGYVPVSCPTGNCTWDPYWSLGMCAQVTDVTTELKMDCEPFEWWEARSSYGWTSGAPLCNYTLPWPSEYPQVPTLSNDPDTHGWPGFNMSGQSGPSIDSKLPNLIRYRMLSWTSPADSKPFSDKAQALPSIAAGAGAVDVQLYPCMRRYGASVENGTFKETEMQTAPMLIYPQNFMGFKDPAGAMTADIACLNQSERSILRAVGYDLSFEDHWLGIAGDDFELAFTKIRGQCLFAMLGNFFEGAPQIFQSLWGIGADSSHLYQGIKAGGRPDQFQSSATVQALYDFGNVTFEALSDRFNGIARSLTSYMRRVPGDVPLADRGPALGTVWTSDTCVAVQWWWICLPGSLFLFTTTYLLATLVIQAATGCQSWKSSSLPLLYHGLEDKMQNQGCRLGELSEMERVARSSEVQLQDMGTHWRFVRLQTH